MRRKRGPIRIIVGLVMIVVGLAGVGTGIVRVVNERDRIEEEAVARGTLPEAVAFTATEPREYRIFLLGDYSEETIDQTACETSTGERLNGSNQSVSITLGSASSVGTFDAPAGETTVSCAGPDGASFVVTPTAGSLIRSVLMIIAGALLAVAGMVLAIWGLVGRRVPA